MLVGFPAKTDLTFTLSTMTTAAIAPSAAESGNRPASVEKGGAVVIGSFSPTPLGPKILHADEEAARLSGYDKTDLESSPLGLIYDHTQIDRLIEKLPSIAKQRGYCFMERDLLRNTDGNVRAFWTIRPMQHRGEEVFALTFAPLEKHAHPPVPEEKEIVNRVAPRAEVAANRVEEEPAPAENQAAKNKVVEVTQTEVAIDPDIRSLSFCTSGVAHDFKNALQNIMMNLEMANLAAEEAGAVEAEIRSYLGKAKVSLKQSRKLAEQLFHLAKGEPPKVSVFDLGQTVRETARFASAGTTATIRLSIHPELRLIEADENIVERVIQNLLTNANEAMPKGGTIDLSASNRIVGEKKGPGENFCVPPGRYSVISVRDRGCGISEENLPHIFEPDFSTKADGWGFGLASCKAAVEAQGGHILVASRRRVGTQFLLFFPWSEKPLPEKTETTPSSGPQRRGAKPAAPPSRILLVEDEAGIAESTSIALQRFGHATMVVPSGEQALSAFRRHLDSAEPIDLVLLDMSLSGRMQGEEAFEEMRRLDDSIPVIATSGRFEGDGSEAVISKYYAGVLAKPFSIDEMLAAVDTVLCY